MQKCKIILISLLSRPSNNLTSKEEKIQSEKLHLHYIFVRGYNKEINKFAMTNMYCIANIRHDLRIIFFLLITADNLYKRKRKKSAT